MKEVKQVGICKIFQVTDFPERFRLNGKYFISVKDGSVYVDRDGTLKMCTCYHDTLDEAEHAAMKCIDSCFRPCELTSEGNA